MYRPVDRRILVPNRRVTLEGSRHAGTPRVLGAAGFACACASYGSFGVKKVHLAHHACAAPSDTRRMHTTTTPPTLPPTDGPISKGSLDVSARRSPDEWDRAIAQIAAAQHGLVALWQLKEIGMSRAAAHWRVGVGRLHRLYEGVYAVGHVPSTRRCELMAAVLACGPRSVLSHRSAAELWGLQESRRGPIDVTAPARRGRAPRGIASHRDSTLVKVDRTSVQGIPCTSLARTLLDFAAVAPIWELRKAVSEAEVLRILDHSAVRISIRRHRGRRGVARLRLAIDEIRPETKRTRSEMEREFLRLCEQANLPRPEVNVSLRVGGRTQKPDFLWRDAGLIFEADSRTYHDTDSAFQVDRKREQRFQLAGWSVSHCTWEQVFQEPAALMRTVRGLLAGAEKRRRWADTSRSP